MATGGSGTTLPVEQRIGHYVKRAEQALMARKAQVLRPAGLTVAQYTALMVLAEHPGLSGAQIARRCYVTPQTMVTILTALEGKGLLTRQASTVHSQVRQCTLTRQGRALLRAADAQAVDVETRLGAAFTADEQAQLIALLERATAALS